MRVGKEIKCPHCGSDAFVIKKTLMDGWTNLGEILACSACGEKIADLNTETEQAHKTNSAKSALASFLDVEIEKKQELHVTDKEKQFCKDCGHYIIHPFLSRCSLFEKEVDPMDDCDKFIRRESNE